jgi:hypothetical protein
MLELTITSVNSATDNIADSLETINNNYNSLFLATSGLEDEYNLSLSPLVQYYENYYYQLKESFNLYETYKNEWNDFLTTVISNSSKWLTPMTIFYPTIIEDPISDDDIYDVNNWLRKFFPIKNSDDTSNYVDGQIFIVNCYTYEYSEPIKVLNQPYSYCNCQTYSGRIALHCQTRITGGWINCNQGSYNCDKVINCYPTKDVDCWYESPYLHENGNVIKPTDATATKRKSISKIQANISMEYTDRRENSIKTFIFRVSQCDWEYRGTTI